MSLKKSIVLIVIVLLVDQISKIYVKTHFILHESIDVFSWFKIYFIENDGMAWGTKISDFTSFISDRTAKVALTLFRVFAIFGIGYWLYNTTKKGGSTILIIAIALIFAGALGNIIDSVFYGVLFNDSTSQLASFMPEGGGYESLLYGRVVDMLYFPLIEVDLPQWVPLYGGKRFNFFEPVFNIADVAISAGFIMLLLFNKKAFSKKNIQ
ncbi:lipoprotein signal peptidase [Tamlana fucoidanivorans]|uniref:Lipoprotein signal peptidase n=1 Tax=Allotamlana fucoidanivorans TaxID=2583814 RepID=A0A5C4SP06_9FLAO|nr:lipoprotein signal peptidase [Tamlana fucoidanivorans]TNJ45380.1 lipoprotein signal peptidase [Tamlana fucoidanivorans]